MLHVQPASAAMNGSMPFDAGHYSFFDGMGDDGGGLEGGLDDGLEGGLEVGIAVRPLVFLRPLWPLCLAVWKLQRTNSKRLCHCSAAEWIPVMAASLRGSLSGSTVNQAQSIANSCYELQQAASAFESEITSAEPDDTQVHSEEGDICMQEEST